jgi:hypothetical protein
VLVPDITVFAYVGGFFYLCTTSIAVGYGPQQFLLNQILYSGVLAAFLLDLAMRRWPIGGLNLARPTTERAR